MVSVGRLAPSPTGAQHLGNARTYLFAWLLARQSSGKIFLRIEDLETPRIKTWATQQAIDDLAWLGLDWDESPNLPKKNLPAKDSSESLSQYAAIGICLQSERIDRYEQILTQLKSQQAVYPCTCTRSDVEQSLAAPHESTLDGIVYPGTCASQTVEKARELDHQGVTYCWRFRMPTQSRSWIDRFAGEQSLASPLTALGDFVIGRSNKQPAYQLAVVVDDHDMGINQVVRGRDLIYSNYRQLAIYDALRWSPPDFYHLPLVVGEDGRRLAKRHGDTRLATFKEQGVGPEEVVGFLAYHSGWIDNCVPIHPRELLKVDILGRQNPEPLVLSKLLVGIPQIVHDSM